MADKEREAPRPRRAYIEGPATDSQPTSTPPAPTPTSPRVPPSVEPDEKPPPLYRDEVADATTIRPRTESAGPPSATPASSHPSAGEETQILSRARAQQTRARDTDATAILPRTASGSRVRRPPEPDDDLDERPTGGRGRRALLVSAVAGVVVLGLAVLFLLIRWTEDPQAQPSPPSSPAPSASTGSPSSSTSPSASAPAALLTDSSMMSPQAAKAIDDDRTWKVALTQRGSSPDSPQPACLGGDPVDGQPTPQQTMLRLLSSSGRDAPGVLHRADAFATPEDAAQAYAIASKTLGGCTMAGTYIDSGRVVTGLGDQSLGIVLNVADGSKTEFRSVVLSRTGRVVDIVDVAQPEDKVAVAKVADAAIEPINAQCRAAGGTCVTRVEVKAGPPPVGGDEPGFLATGDLPPVGDELLQWVGATPGLPDSDELKGSGCETTDWAKVEAESRGARTYLLQNGSRTFGLDQVVIVTNSDKDARDLAEKTRKDWESCSDRQLTATVADPTEVRGTGAKDSDIEGWTTEVIQKATDSTSRFRVGIVSVGPKVVFTFLNPVDGLDLTDRQFDRVTVRAGERATQVR